MLDILISVILYKIFWKAYENASKIQLTEHILSNAALGILLFLAAAKIGMLVVSLVILALFFMEIFRLYKEMTLRIDI